MKTVVFDGPGESRTYVRGAQKVTFEVGKPQEVEGDFAAELLGQNPDGLTLEQAEPYGIPVFREVKRGGGGLRSTVAAGGSGDGGEVGG
jgi:hypothetical protein